MNDQHYGRWSDLALLLGAGATWRAALHALGMDADEGDSGVLEDHLERAGLLPPCARALVALALQHGAGVEIARVLEHWSTSSPCARTWKAIGNLVPAGLAIEPLSAALVPPDFADVATVAGILEQGSPERMAQGLATLRDLGRTGLASEIAQTWAHLALGLVIGLPIADAVRAAGIEAPFDPMQDSLAEWFDQALAPDEVERTLLRLAEARGQLDETFAQLARRQSIRAQDYQSR